MIEGPIEEQTGPAERKSRWFKVDVLAVIRLIKRLVKKPHEITTTRNK